MEPKWKISIQTLASVFFAFRWWRHHVHSTVVCLFCKIFARDMVTMAVIKSRPQPSRSRLKSTTPRVETLNAGPKLEISKCLHIAEIFLMLSWLLSWIQISGIFPTDFGCFFSANTYLFLGFLLGIFNSNAARKCVQLHYTRQPHFRIALWRTNLALAVQTKHSKSHKILQQCFPNIVWWRTSCGSRAVTAHMAVIQVRTILIGFQTQLGLFKFEMERKDCKCFSNLLQIFRFNTVVR